MEKYMYGYFSWQPFYLGEWNEMKQAADTKHNTIIMQTSHADAYK